MAVSPPPQIARRRWPTAVGLILVPMALGLCVGAYMALTSFFLALKTEATPGQAQFFARSMDAAISRLVHLPYVVAIDPSALKALQDEDGTGLNPVLATIAQRAKAEFIFLMDINGLTIASSNYQDSESLVGNHYTFRPYFQQALTGVTGRFYAVGATTGRPGYFIAEPVRDASGTIFGVVVVKIGFEDLSAALSNSGELVLVTNPEGVVVASSAQELVYGLLSPLSAFARRTLEDQQKFGDNDLHALNWQEDGARRVRLNGTAFLWTQSALQEEQWTLHLLSEIDDIRRQALIYVAGGVLGLLTLGIAAALFRAAQLRRALAISDADRTRLAKEIEDRRRAEAQLRAAQTELARKNRLAAMGELSASITHELGQPVSAMRNYLAAEEIGADVLPGQLSPQLSGLVDRMQSILSQLRSFGRHAPEDWKTFSLADSVDGAIDLVRHSAEAANVTLTKDLPESAVWLAGAQGRFEQVLVNLLRNAIDATKSSKAGAVHLGVTLLDASVELRVIDQGPGLGDLGVDDLREPFFTTKPSGEGMGLGLAISTQIVNEMEGELMAANHRDGGAVFTLRLPRQKDSNG